VDQSGIAAGSLLRRDRLVVLLSLAVVAGVAWVYIAHLAAGMGQISGAMIMPQTHPWSLSEILGLVVMWAVMMTAMMIPSAAPTILLFANLTARRRSQGIATASPAVFVGGYLLVWAGYSVLAALIQTQLHSSALLSPMMVSASPLLGGALLMAAGLYQLLPIKRRCLAHCRSPLGFLMGEWREGTRGALVMGLRHGSYCVGCCWLLMSLLFVAGVMNLVWVATLTFIVLTEKLAPGARNFSRPIGALLILAGFWLLLGGR
jgi:predicted metal-binding membrane protein